MIEHAHIPTVAFIGGGPMALMAALEFVRSAPDQSASSKPEQLLIISKEPEEKLGYGDITDTVHKEVLFNVTAGKMSLDPENPNELVNQLERTAIDAETADRISRFNHAYKLKDQFVPRVLLQPVAQRDAETLRKEAAAKGIKYEYIQGEVTNMYDSCIASGERKASRSSVILEIKFLDENRDRGKTMYRPVDVAALTFGSPKRVLPDEEALASLPTFSADLNHPPKGHILHPGNAMDTLPAEYTILIVGSKLSAIDVVVVLSERGYFTEPGHKATLISPHGEFPYPHEAVPSNTEEYKKNSFLSDVGMPARLREPKTAQDLADSVVLTCLHAVDICFDGKNWTIPLQDEANNKVIERLVQKANEIYERLEEGEKECITQKFAATRKVFGWQVALDVDFRPRIEKIWKGFATRQKKLWMQSPDYENLYNDLRHRVPAKVHALLVDLQRQNKIVVKQGKIANMSEKNGKIQVFANGNNRTALIEGDQLVKATGWEQYYPIDEIPLLRNMRRNGMLHKDEATDGGVVVSKNNTHNVEIIGQLNKVKKYEISGFQQLRTHAIEEAGKLWEMLQEQRQLGESRDVGERHDMLHTGRLSRSGRSLTLWTSL